MPEAQLNFTNNQQSGLDELGEASPVAMNVMMSGKTVRRRPCIAPYDGAPETSINPDGVTGLYVVRDGRLFAVAGVTPDREIYRVSPGGAASLSGVPQGDLPGTGRPQFTETEPILVITGGLRIQKVLLSGIPTVSPLRNAPPSAFVLGNDQRILASGAADAGEEYVAYSGKQASGSAYDQFEVWGDGIGTSGFFPAGARPDETLWAAENTNEVFVWGRTSLQVFTPNPEEDYAPVTTREVGLGALYSVIKSDQQFAWLDHLRRFVMSDGREVVPLSGPIQQTLNDLDVVDDCWGFRFQEGAVDAFVWNFKSDGRTFAFQRGSGWSEWQGWNPVGERPRRMPVSAHHLSQGAAVNIVGLEDGRIARLTQRATTDLGETVHAYVTTGFENRGTDARKHCRSVRLTLRRGETTSSTEPVALVSYRNDLGPWNPPLRVSLGFRGTHETVVSFRGLGTYRRRQWRFEFTGTEQLVLADATEEFEVLEA